MTLSLKDKIWLFESYQKILESRAQPNNFKNLTPEQAQRIAALSPSYVSNDVWGSTSAWLCSRANNMIKYQKKSFGEVFELLSSISQYIREFEQLSKKQPVDINTLKNLNEFLEWVNQRKEAVKYDLSPKAKKDGRVRQAYSLIKRGIETDDMVITYEDETWLIGYPTNFDYNKRFAPVGEWCHTSSMEFFRKYAKWPILYCVNKQEGYVLCASFQEYSLYDDIDGVLNGIVRHGENEIRDQEDNEPAGWSWDGDWNSFWIDKGLEKPMVDNIMDTCAEYDPPQEILDIKGELIERMEYDSAIREEILQDYGFMECDEVEEFSNGECAGKYDAKEFFLNRLGDNKADSNYYSGVEMYNFLNFDIDGTFDSSRYEINEKMKFIIKEFITYQPFIDKYENIRFKVSNKILSLTDVLKIFINQDIDRYNIDSTAFKKIMMDLIFKISEWFGKEYLYYSVQEYCSYIALEADAYYAYIIANKIYIMDVAAENYVHKFETGKRLFDSLETMIPKITDGQLTSDFIFKIPRMSIVDYDMKNILNETDEIIEALTKLFEKGV